MEFVLQVSATLSILLTWIDGPEFEALEPMPEALEPAPDSVDPDALEPMLDEPLADGLLAELAPLAPAPAALLFVTVPVTATSCPMCWFNFEVSALAGMTK